ncbi:MAG: malonic semialdehyde reductase [Alphaproteobacteria bacterium]|nr:malonic semialdehyde reductase [Alphaproteobacteria bacterium]
MTAQPITTDTSKEAWLNKLFKEARTHFKWQQKDVPDSLLEDLYDLVKMGPTSANCLPIRLVFVKSPEGKEMLKDALMEGNIEKTMTAPATAIVAYDANFFEDGHKLYPHADTKSWYEGKPEFAEKTALYNSTLQAGYLIMAARSLGLDCGPMTGFSPKKVNETFFKDKPNFKATMLVNLGYGDPSVLHPRAPKPNFGDYCQVV